MHEEPWTSYERMGRQFLVHAESSPYNAHYDRPAVLSALGDVDGLRVLDAGCGPGLYLEELVARGAVGVGFDASPTMVALARERLDDRAHIDVVALGERLPYDGESFDAAVCALAIHHVRDRRAAFLELYRVLRGNGRLVVSTHHPTTDWLRKGGSYFDHVLESDDWLLPDGRRQRVHFWREPLSTLCDAATDGGFVIERLIEPRPTKEMGAVAPRDYERLQQEPGFVILVLRKLG